MQRPQTDPYLGGPPGCATQESKTTCPSKSGLQSLFLLLSCSWPRVLGKGRHPESYRWRSRVPKGAVKHARTRRSIGHQSHHMRFPGLAWKTTALGTSRLSDLGRHVPLRVMRFPTRKASIKIPTTGQDRVVDCHLAGHLIQTGVPTRSSATGMSSSPGVRHVLGYRDSPSHLCDMPFFRKPHPASSWPTAPADDDSRTMIWLERFLCLANTFTAAPGDIRDPAGSSETADREL